MHTPTTNKSIELSGGVKGSNLVCRSARAYERSATFKSPKRQFRQSKITQHANQLQSVTVQQHSRYQVDSSVRIFFTWQNLHLEQSHLAYKSAKVCESSEAFKTISRRFSKTLFTQQTVHIKQNYTAYKSAKDCDSSETLKPASRQISNALLAHQTVQIEYNHTA